MRHLLSLSIDTERIKPEQHQQFPFSVGSIQSLFDQELEFNSDVTFLVGENGSGKSTLLEAIACAVGSITVGSESVERDPSLASVRQLAKSMRLSWRKKTKRGFFMRSEDFFAYAKNMRNALEELQGQLRAVEEDRSLSPTARAYGRVPFASQAADLQRRYGDGLDNHSHGESFFALFQSRFVPDGLYLLDEPEAPLSPLRQIGFMSLIKQMVETQNAQFIIATHSPILMAFPKARILGFAAGGVREVAYGEVEHVTVTRDFLAHPERFLRHL